MALRRGTSASRLSLLHSLALLLPPLLELLFSLDVLQVALGYCLFDDVLLGLLLS